MILILEMLVWGSLISGNMFFSDYWSHHQLRQQVLRWTLYGLRA
jgi:hypothetical protein